MKFDRLLAKAREGSFWVTLCIASVPWLMILTLILWAWYVWQTRFIDY